MSIVLTTPRTIKTNLPPSVRLCCTFILSLFLFSSAADARSNLRFSEMRGVPDEYIIVLSESVTSEQVHAVAAALRQGYGIQVLKVWNNALNGFLCRAPRPVIERLAADSRVRFIEQNTITDAPLLSSTQWTSFNGEYLWHLDRVDELSWANRDSQHNMCTEGRNSVAYVIDTGVQADHPQFENPSRVVLSLDFSDDRTNLNVPNTTYSTDVTNGCTTTGYVNGNLWHGTAVASVLGGTQIGVAKPQIVSLKIARCANFEVRVDSLISAVDWIGSVNDPYRTWPGVINHSGFIPEWWSTPSHVDYWAYSTAVSGSVTNHQKPFFTSADNFSTDACQFSPNILARTPNRSGDVMVVGGTTVSPDPLDPNDYRHQIWYDATTPATGQDSGSNAGTCVSIYAPAAEIFAARTSASGVLYGRASGTSFASPLVAGIAARYMQKQQSTTGIIPSHHQVYTWLLANAAAVPQQVTTPGYWFCARAPLWHDGHRTRRDYTWLSNPPSVCPNGSWGHDPFGGWVAGGYPVWLPSRGNDSGAKMVYWDEGNCP